MNGFRRRRVPEEVDQEAVLSLLKDAIDFMDTKQSGAYRQALSVCPEVVENESNPLEFLSFDDFDIWKAAQRLMNYWRWRVDLFKEERAFLPILDLSGEGALNELDICLMQKGKLIMLPKNVYGDPIVFTDRYRNRDDSLSDEPFDSAFRVMFAFHLFQDREEGTDWGVLNLLSTLPTYLVGKKNWAQMVEEALPIRIKWVRMVVLRKKNEKRTWFERIHSSIREAIFKKLGSTKAEIHSYNSIQDLKRDLLSVGFLEHALPESVGGTWSYENFYSWFAEKSKTLEGSNLQNNKNTKTASFEVARSKIQKPKATIFQKPDTIQNKFGSKSTDQVALQETGTSHGSQQCNNSETPLYDPMMPTPVHQSRIEVSNSNVDVAPRLMEAAIECLSTKEKCTLTAIKTKNPEIFRRESYLNVFYQYHNRQAGEAVKHLEHFFKLREKIFGDRKFHPMNQLGSGAMKREDVKTLNTSFLVILPPDRADNKVIFYDPSRCAHCRFASQRRCWYYVVSLLLRWAGEEKVNVRVLVHIDKNMADHESKHACGRRKLYDILNSIPLEIDIFHVILDSDGQDDHSYVENASLALTSLFQPSIGQAVFHKLIPGGNILEELQLYGFKEEGIPSIFGGRLSDSWFQSLQQDIIDEEEMNFHGKNQNIPTSAEGPIWQGGKENPILKNLKRKHSVPNEPDLPRESEQTLTVASIPNSGIGSLFSAAAPLSITDIAEYSSQQFNDSVDPLASSAKSPPSKSAENTIKSAQAQSHQEGQLGDDFKGWSSTFSVHLAEYWQRRMNGLGDEEKS